MDFRRSVIRLGPYSFTNTVVSIPTYAIHDPCDEALACARNNYPKTTRGKVAVSTRYERY